MERMQRQINVDPIPEDETYAVPKFLHKSNSLASTSSKGSLSRTASDLNHIGEISEKAAEAAMTPTVEAAHNPPVDRNISNNNCDEGLGESFDQQSEMSDSSQSIRATNGFNGMDTVPEERTAEDKVQTTPSHEEIPPPPHSDLSPTTNQNTELTLDPSTLESPTTDTNSSKGSQESLGENGGSPFAKKAGSIKKVSFFAGAEDDQQDSGEPVSDTYVYEGRPKKFSAALKRLGLKKE